jgi:sRNA-binding regulator protein Hfq
VSAFVIEKDGEIKEKFSYEILFNRTTQQSLVAYSHANYGPEAVFRHMTDEEQVDFLAPTQNSS